MQDREAMKHKKSTNANAANGWNNPSSAIKATPNTIVKNLAIFFLLGGIKSLVVVNSK